MALNQVRCLVGCCISAVCILEVRNKRDLLKVAYSGGSPTTVYLVRNSDTETLKWLGDCVTAKENLGEFSRVQLETSKLVTEMNVEIIATHNELMKNRESLIDFQPGDVVIQKKGTYGFEEFEVRDWPVSVSQTNIARHKGLGQVCLYCKRGNDWVPWDYSHPANNLWRVK